jgi:hypothetical protein
MTFDFSHLYTTETIKIQVKGKIVFSVVVQEIPHGAKADAQKVMLSNIDLNLKGMKKDQINSALANGMSSSLKSGNLDVGISADMESIAAIQSWTLTDKKGDPVPICLEAWRALPEIMTVQIEEAIERLNPEMDEDFQD